MLRQPSVPHVLVSLLTDSSALIPSNGFDEKNPSIISGMSGYTGIRGIEISRPKLRIDAIREMLSPCESIVVLLVHTKARTVARVSYRNSLCLARSR